VSADSSHNKPSILVLPGDGIGPEVMSQSLRVLDWLDRNRGISFDLQTGLIGGAAIDSVGTPIDEATMEAAHRADALLFGAVGGPKWDTLPFSQRPERGILRIRKELELFGNIRVAKTYSALADASTLRPEVIEGLDIIVLRENVGGMYFGEPRGILQAPDGGRYGVNTHIYTELEIGRVARLGFDLARSRYGRLCSVDKANVMESGELWRLVVQRIGDDEYPDVTLSHMYADNCAMQLVRAPKQFDVIVTDNLFGDILSDCAGVLTGSLGMLPSASVGVTDGAGRRPALYEPIHGSAPDIACSDVANPLAAILSVAMMLRLSFSLLDEAQLIERAVASALETARTADIMQPSCRRVSTRGMGDAVLTELDRHSHR
jgi:3-isopropylmalate dehydrogenase